MGQTRDWGNSMSTKATGQPIAQPCAAQSFVGQFTAIQPAKLQSGTVSSAIAQSSKKPPLRVRSSSAQQPIAQSPALESYCEVAHQLLNKLSIIVGNCELLNEHEMSPECSSRLNSIQAAAFDMTHILRQYQCARAASTIS